jgi:hypothetical protein
MILAIAQRKSLLVIAESILFTLCVMVQHICRMTQDLLFAVVGVSPTTLVACVFTSDGTSDGKREKPANNRLFY